MSVGRYRRYAKLGDSASNLLSGLLVPVGDMEVGNGSLFGKIGLWVGCSYPGQQTGPVGGFFRLDRARMMVR